ncbi:MAG: hypothetical protein A2201_12910 [Alicyclobacillus sp. RIFOXYA1_FULL_53_8]|nr:MAG: hypothetical protein A2201_12910 [Alicyclobacillus sp. RIFOXYA1_FULL_53_8]
MRFFLFGRGEGVRADCEASLWASIREDKVTDASISARKQGVHSGMKAKSAQALVPSLTLCEDSEREGPSELVKRVWQLLWTFSPWLETISDHSFLLQIPAAQPPLREVRDLMLRLQALFTTEQRFRLGLAENPFLAKSLVAWSGVERVRDASYFKVREQELLVSPGLSPWLKETLKSKPCENATVSTQWIRQMPLASLWLLPESTRFALWELGLRRLEDLETVAPRTLQQRFGKPALTWLQWLNQSLGGRVSVNYPPEKFSRVWKTAIDERLLPEFYFLKLTSLTEVLARDLERTGTGALKVGMEWVTEEGKQCFERALKHPAYQLDFLLAQLQSGLELLPACGIEQLTVYAEHLQPLTPVQLSLWHEGESVRQIVARENLRERFGVEVRESEEKRKSEVEKLLHQVNHKFPNGLHIGVRPTFRELRLQAVVQGQGG